MPIKSAYQTFRNIVLPATLNSYSTVFFFNNRFFSIVFLFVTFFNFFAGLSGLLAVLIAVIIAHTMGLDQTLLKKGLFSFNALLTGIGMGAFFDPSLVFFTLLALASLLTLILSVTLGSWLYKYGLPVLSIPFIIAIWFVILPSSQFENLGLTQRNIYWMNEMYAVGGKQLLSLFQTIDNLPLHNLVDTYFRSISSIFFQNNLIAGFLISLALLICSRIMFSLSIIGFLSAYFFAHFSGSEAASITYYNIGANYMMVAFAIGGFFVIPSRYSYLWTILLIPLTSLVLLFFIKLFGFIQLPIFSLPFAFVVIFFLYFLRLRSNPTKLIVTPFQYNLPEINLYNFNNNKSRLAHSLYFPLYLPFWGEWTVTQGHDGEHTHIGDWGKAYDFMILDTKGKTYSSNGYLPENYYCYNKPVLAPADGIVESIIDNIDDNEIGTVNTVNNWGNTIIIRHVTGLYTQMSHLKKGTFKVSKGDSVKMGDIIANCGNSGRSPQPHLHFQVQTTPIVGSKTLDYPFAYYLSNENLNQFARPQENERIVGMIGNSQLKNAFNLYPNSTFKFNYKNENAELITENWVSYTDAYNYKYLYCKETEAYAYYVLDEQMFYFTAFYGNKNSLLYYFYCSAYKIFLGNTEAIEINDIMPLNIVRNKPVSSWLHDFIAPFHNYIKVNFTSKVDNTIEQAVDNSTLIKSQITVSILNKKRVNSLSTITISNGKIVGFSYKSGNKTINAYE